MKAQERLDKASAFYSSLLNMYPGSYQKAFGKEALQTFRDYYRDVYETKGSIGIWFWFDVMSDEIRNIVREQIAYWKGQVTMKNTWIKQGIIFGVILGIFHMIFAAINNLAPASNSLSQVLNWTIVLVPILCGIAGFTAARKARSIKAGIYAGVLTGAISIGIAMISLFLITFTFMDTIRQNAFMIQDFQRSGAKSMDQFIIEDAIGAILVGTVASLFFGGVLGTVGGFLGTNFNSVKTIN